MKEIKVAIVQMNVFPGRPEKNIARASSFLEEACKNGAQVAILPELWLSGYVLNRVQDFASPLGEGYFQEVAALARKYSIYLIGSTLEEKDGRFYNTATIFSPEGELLGAYRKIHLYAPMDETKFLSPGDETPIFSLPWGKTALAICYDLRFPELFRLYTLKGAEIIFIPAHWPEKRIAHWRLLLRARAVENQLFVVGCNRTKNEFGGWSGAYSPLGEAIAEGGKDEEVLLASLNMEEVSWLREKFPALKDRRPEIYALI
jgi:predicted amidohydrolase